MLLLLLLAMMSKAIEISMENIPPQQPNESKEKVKQVQELSDNTIVLIYGFFRHGIRSPLYETYPNDIHKVKFHQYFKGPVGELTTVGIKQMYSVGKNLNNVYGKFVGDYSENTVYVSATDTRRTIMSAATVMAAMFPPKKPIFKDIKWQPIPIWQNTKGFDIVYFYNDPAVPKLAFKRCKNLGLLMKNALTTIMTKNPREKYPQIFELLEKNTGKQVTSFRAANEIIDVLQFEKLNGLALPNWATELHPELHNKPLFPDLIRPILGEVLLAGKNEEMISFYAGPLLNNINEQMKEKVTKKGNKMKFKYHSTHDITLYMLLWALGIQDPTLEVQTGDGIVIELHNQKGMFVDKYLVQVVYYHANKKDDNFRKVLELPKCPSPCPYEKFIKEYPGLTPQQWERKCNP